MQHLTKWVKRMGGKLKKNPFSAVGDKTLFRMYFYQESAAVTQQPKLQQQQQQKESTTTFKLKLFHRLHLFLPVPVRVHLHY